MMRQVLHTASRCDQLEAIGDPLLRMIETTFGTALADVWRQ